jgi:hypothetical protein
MAVGIRHADHVAPSIRKFGNHFADKRRSLGRYSSLADSDVKFFFFFGYLAVPCELNSLCSVHGIVLNSKYLRMWVAGCLRDCGEPRYA